MDSAAGMGFGTGLTPLLLFLGYAPLQIVPTLLISEAITGVLDTYFDNEFGNVNFKFHPLNASTKLALIIGSFGCASIFFSIIITYLAFKFPANFIKLYVAILVILMGIFGIIRPKFKQKDENESIILKPKRVIGFSLLAGFNKGIGGGGYGPVITMSQIYSGIYEKSATAIVSFSEAMVSIVGIFTFFFISYVGVDVDLILLPSIFTGGFIAAILSPYLVRVFPNKIWKYIIPIYAIGMGVLSLLDLFIF